MENKTTSSNLDGYTLAVVHSSIRYLGYVNNGAKAGEVVHVRQAYEFSKGVTAIPQPAGPPDASGRQAVGITTIPTADINFVDAAERAVDISVLAHCIRTQASMDVLELRKYQKAIDSLQKQEQVNRAKNAGITLATALPTKTPNGPIQSHKTKQ